MSLADWQFALGGVTFGQGTSYHTVMEISKPDTIVQDQPRPLDDGILFGRDFLPGMTLVFSFVIDSGSGNAATALSLLESLREAWQGDDVRLSPGGQSILQYKTPTLAQRRVFGRPRKFTPSTEDLGAGVVAVDADFMCRDHLFYSDIESTLTILHAGGLDHGFTAPLTSPLNATQARTRYAPILSSGKAPTPIKVRFNGPITNPMLVVTPSPSAQPGSSGGAISLAATIRLGQYVELDGAARTVKLNGVTNYSKYLTRDSKWFKLPGGLSEAAFSGSDASFQSTAQVFWRDAWYSL